MNQQLPEPADKYAEADEIASRVGYFRLIRDLLAFQFKLFLDGLRDVLLSPISFISVIVGIVLSPKRPGKYFYRLMDLGYASDHWINLFNKHNEENEDRISPDAFVRHAETIVLNEYKKKNEKGQKP